MKFYDFVLHLLQTVSKNIEKERNDGMSKLMRFLWDIRYMVTDVCDGYTVLQKLANNQLSSRRYEVLLHIFPVTPVQCNAQIFRLPLPQNLILRVNWASSGTNHHLRMSRLLWISIRPLVLMLMQKPMTFFLKLFNRSRIQFLFHLLSLCVNSLSRIVIPLCLCGMGTVLRMHCLFVCCCVRQLAPPY